MTDAPWTWFVIRSSGLVAVGLLTISVALGLVGPRLRPTARLAAISTHRAASLVGSVLVAAHIVLGVTDTWITLDWPSVFVPGVAGWERVGIGLGALAVDLVLAVLITTAVRLRAPRLWRRVHLLAYPMWALMVGHGLLVGSDGQVMRTLALACVALVGLALAARLLVRPQPVALGAPGRVLAGQAPR